MKVVADTNTFLAVALNEPERQWLIEVTAEHQLVAPAVLPYEIANAISALIRRKAVAGDRAEEIWRAAARIPVELAEIDILAALRLAADCGVYAYDGYFLQCALEARCPLLTLDKTMRRVARELGIRLVEP
jgi:predicted nucleic acid-binding protein